MADTNYQSDLLAVIKRRPVGKGAWKVTINEITESQREVVATLRSIRHRHPGDAATQADVAAALDSITEILIKLGELLHYKEGGCAAGPEASAGNGNGA
jgi:hypothetical protein